MIIHTVIAITIKELRILFRDRAAILIMFALPLALTFVTYFAFGDIDRGPTGIPIMVHNADTGELGQALVTMLFSDELRDRLSPQLADSAAAARAAVEDDQAAVAVLIPAGLSEQISSASIQIQKTSINLYTHPSWQISSGIVQGIVNQFAEVVNVSVVGTEATLIQLITTGRIRPDAIATLAEPLAQELAQSLQTDQPIEIHTILPETESDNAFSFGEFSFVAYYAPSLAILALMFSLTSAARSILQERESGTLARFRATPAAPAALIAGKITGTILTGMIQMIVLITLTSLLMDIRWGAIVPVLLLTLLVVTAVAAMGIMLASFARTNAQAESISSAVVLILSALSGNFLPRPAFPDWLQKISYIGPSAWGIEGYQMLQSGAGVADMASTYLALTIMTGTFFLIALLGLRKVVR